jgi:hypothetical protein
MNDTTKKLNKIINTYFSDKMPENVKRLGNLIYWDLMFGPLQGCDVCGADTCDDCLCATPWPGFTTATKLVSDWLDDQPSELWIDLNFDGVMESEPQPEYLSSDCEERGCDPYLEPDYENVYYVDRKEIVAALFGKEVVGYI